MFRLKQVKIRGAGDMVVPQKVYRKGWYISSASALHCDCSML